MSKKIIIGLLAATMTLSVGCNNTKTIDETTGVLVSEEVDGAEVDEPVTEETEEAETVVMETPVEDVYKSITDPVVYDMTAYEGVEGEIITDQALISDMEAYFHDLYFNYYFLDAIDGETGNITAEAMELFAVSYIMQYENEELQIQVLDDNIKLNIPKDHVQSVVRDYFYRSLETCNSYPELNIEFNEGTDTYAVIVEDGTWDVELVVSEVKKVGDFTYEVVCDLNSKVSGRTKNRIDALVDESYNGPAVVNIKITEVVDEESSDE